MFTIRLIEFQYCFPPQPQVIAACAELAKRIVCGVDTRNGSDLDLPGKQKTMDTIFSKVEDPAIGVRPEKKMLVVIGYVPSQWKLVIILSFVQHVLRWERTHCQWCVQNHLLPSKAIT